MRVPRIEKITENPLSHERKTWSTRPLHASSEIHGRSEAKQFIQKPWLVISNNSKSSLLHFIFLSLTGCLKVAVECQSTCLCDQILIDSNVLSGLLPISRLLNASEW